MHVFTYLIDLSKAFTSSWSLHLRLRVCITVAVFPSGRPLSKYSRTKIRPDSSKQGKSPNLFGLVLKSWWATKVARPRVFSLERPPTRSRQAFTGGWESILISRAVLTALNVATLSAKNAAYGLLPVPYGRARLHCRILSSSFRLLACNGCM